jgi:hypothetical protein
MDWNCVNFNRVQVLTYLINDGKQKSEAQGLTYNPATCGADSKRKMKVIPAWGLTDLTWGFYFLSQSLHHLACSLVFVLSLDCYLSGLPFYG